MEKNILKAFRARLRRTINFIFDPDYENGLRHIVTFQCVRLNRNLKSNLLLFFYFPARLFCKDVPIKLREFCFALLNVYFFLSLEHKESAKNLNLISSPLPWNILLFFVYWLFIDFSFDVYFFRPFINPSSASKPSRHMTLFGRWNDVFSTYFNIVSTSKQRRVSTGKWLILDLGDQKRKKRGTSENEDQPIMHNKKSWILADLKIVNFLSKIATLRSTIWKCPSSLLKGSNEFNNNIIFHFPSDQTRAYFSQLRQELGQRILDKVYESNSSKPSKVWYTLIGDTFANLVSLGLFFAKVSPIS